jgi:trimeric autotransporter adhesin
VCSFRYGVYLFFPNFNFLKNLIMNKSSVCFLIFLLFFALQKSYSQCNNAGFESGNFSNWTGTYGTDYCSINIFGICACYTPLPTQYNGLSQGANNVAPGSTPVRSHFIMTSGYDPTVGGTTIPVVYPGGGTYSARLGNAHGDNPHGGGETLTYQFTVNAGNANFTYHYAVVLNDGGHGGGEQPFFTISMTDGNNNPIGCAAYDVNATTAPSIGGFTTIGNISYKPWTSVFIPLVNYIGQTVRITFTTRDCAPTGCDGSHWAYAYIDAECSPIQIVSSSPTVCGGQTITLTAPAGAASYSWSGPGIIPPNNTQQVLVNQPGQYTVNMTTFGTVPCSFSLDTIIAGNPNNPVADFSATTVCIGNPTVFTDLSTPVGSVNGWAWDFDNNGTTDATTQNPSHTFPAAGTYQVQLTATWGGCTNIITKSVDVLPSPTSIFTATSPVCLGANSVITYTGNAPANATYTWNFDGGTVASGSGQGPYQVNWSSGGVKNITLTVSLGSCVSSVTTMQVTVNNVTGIMVSPSSPTICVGGSVVLNASGGSSYSWSPPTGLSTTTGATVTASPLATTTYTLTGVNAACSSPVSVTVTVVPPPTSIFAALSPVCAGQNSTINYIGSAAANDTYSWNFDGGTVVSGTGQGPFDVNWNTPGTKNISLTVTENGCVSTPTIVSVTVNPSPPSDAGADVTICSGSSTTLGTSSTTGFTYSWSPTADLSDPTASNPVVTSTNTSNAVVTNTYTVTTTGLGCFSTDDVVVTIVPLPVADFTAPVAQCLDGNNFNFQAGGSFLPNASFDWDFGTNASPSNSSSQNQSVVFSTAGQQTVSLTITQLGCVSNTFTDFVNLTTSPVVDFDADSLIGCENFTVCFTDNSASNNPSSYQWNFGDGSNSTAQNICHTFVNAGTYTITLQVTSADGCTSSKTVNNMITVLADPTAAFTVNNSMIQLPHNTIDVTNQSQNATSYLWDFEGAGTSNAVSPQIVFTDSGTYVIKLYAYNQLECMDSTQRIVTVLGPESFYIPNAFTPDGDGINDDFYIHVQGAVKVHRFMVYNRWGEKMHDGAYPWDGKQHGKPCEPEVYVYIFKLGMFADTRIVTKKGSVTLIR